MVTCGCCWWWPRWRPLRANNGVESLASRTQRTAARRDQSRAQHGRDEPSDAHALRPHRARRTHGLDDPAAWRERHRQGARRPRGAPQQRTRADRPFIAINCAALTETLLESELFGHEKGAFTGAIGLKRGKIELADGGTLFLDEIGELPLTLQAKLLRVLQEREFERVGGTRPVRVDFRLIAATNRDLEAAVARRHVPPGSLLPPQRRVAGAAAAARAARGHPAPRRLLRAQARAAERSARSTASNPRRCCELARHDWPGNVRELENAIEQALALGVSDQITAEDLPAAPTLQPSWRQPSSLNYHETVEGTKRDLILRAFEKADQNHARRGAAAGRASQLPAPARQQLRAAPRAKSAPRAAASTRTRIHGRHGRSGGHEHPACSPATLDRISDDVLAQAPVRGLDRTHARSPPPRTFYARRCEITPDAGLPVSFAGKKVAALVITQRRLAACLRRGSRSCAS